MPHLTERDINEGKQLAETFEIMDENSKLLAKVYIGALRDRQMISEQKHQTAQSTSNTERR